MKYYKILHIPTGKYLNNYWGDIALRRVLEDFPTFYTKKELYETFPKNYTFAVATSKFGAEIVAMNYIEFEVMEVGEAK